MKRILTICAAYLICLSADAQIPNPGFENWNDYQLHRLQDWKNYGNIRRVSAPGTYAARLAYDSASADGAGRTGLLFGYVDFSSINLKGGIGYADRPDSIKITLKYDIAMNDSAWILVNFKKNGSSIPMTFDIFRIGGNSGGNFVTRGFKLNFNPAVIGNSDTLLLAITSSDPFLNMKSSWMEIDEVWFVKNGSPTAALPNGDLNNWTQYDFSEPVGWLSVNTLSSKLSGSTFPVSKSTDKDSGTYAIRLESKIDPVLDSLAGTAYTANRFVTGEAPAFPIPARILTMTGTYKYAPVNNDTGLIQVKVYNKGFEVGVGLFQPNGTVSTYTPFTLSVSYNSTFTGMPDSASVLLSSSHPENPRGMGSVLFVDNLKITTNVGVPKFSQNLEAICYPNPTEGPMIFQVTLEAASALELKIYDVSGRLVKTVAQAKTNAGIQHLNADISELSPGIYFYTLISANGMASGKITKE